MNYASRLEKLEVRYHVPRPYKRAILNRDGAGRYAGVDVDGAYISRIAGEPLTELRDRIYAFAPDTDWIVIDPIRADDGRPKAGCDKWPEA